MSCLISPSDSPLGVFVSAQLEEEGQTQAIIAIPATIILISGHASGRLHIQVHHAMGLVEL